MRVSRLVSLLVLTGLALSIVPIPSARAFSDVRSGVTPYAKAIEAMRKRGVVEGYNDNTYKPSLNINRAEFLKIVLESREKDVSGSDCFPDVEEEWFAKYVCAGKEEGIVSGYPDGTFKPEKLINFVEAAKIMTLAFDQHVDTSFPDWYEPYARALEESMAIPLSIEGLDQQVDRGEMAEMMWRLTEGVTDQPAKGYLNVKYPDVAINMASDKPQTAKSCTDLKAFTEEAARQGYAGYGGDVMLRDMAMPVMAPSMAESDSANARAQKSYSDTNVQVAGVDEADIVKTDGTYLYVIRENGVRIVHAHPAKDMKQMSTISFDDNFQPTNLYIEGDRLVVTGTSWGYGGDVHIMNEKRMAAPMIWPGPSMQRSHVRIYNIADRAKPELERTVSFDGYVVSSRKISSKMYLVLNQPVQWYGPRPIPVPLEGDVLPKFQDSARGTTDEPVARCGDVVILPHEPSPEYLTVAVIPLDKPTTEIEREVVLGSAQNIYASLENLYVASTHWKYDWRPGFTESQERTRLYRFAFSDDGIEMKAQGSVPGHILNQFSMDEHEDHFRIATTTQQMWGMESEQEPSKNHVYILNMNMERTGAIEDIAPGETIYSVRFMGDRAYLVTFQKVDPFFALDLSDPDSPKILGKLKIPGYSDYLHPYDEHHIIGFGKEATVAKEGSFAWYQGMKMAIFDVTDPEDPTELHSFAIGDRGTDSPLLHDHHALLFDPDRGLLAFPVRVSKLQEGQDPNDPSAWGDSVFQGAYVFDIDLKKGFQLRGSITHYNDQDYLKAGSSFYGKDVERIVRIEDSLLTVSQEGIQSHSEDAVKYENGITFRPDQTNASCPDPDDPDVSFASKDPEMCKLIDFACASDQEGFSGACGCGCKGK